MHSVDDQKYTAVVRNVSYSGISRLLIVLRIFVWECNTDVGGVVTNENL